MAAGEQGQDVAVPITAERVLAAYPEMVTGIPEAVFDADGSGILADVLMATTWEGLNDTQNTLPDAEKMAGRAIFITGIGRMKSELEGGLGWYLLVDCVDPATGEAAKFQTSSATVMAKLVKLHQFVAAGTIAWPVEVLITKATKPTRQGFYPLDLTVRTVSKPGPRAVADDPGF